MECNLKLQVLYRVIDRSTSAFWQKSICIAALFCEKVDDLPLAMTLVCSLYIVEPFFRQMHFVIFLRNSLKGKDGD